MPKLYIGTAGWSYKDWVPNFYPNAQSKVFDWLQFYSKYFNVVEVNASYYAYLNPKIVNGWVEKVADAEDFLFTFKLHQDFTHKRKFDEQNIKSVQINLDILKKSERLGGLLVQFPYSFAFNNAAAEHIRNLKEIFQNHNLFVEVRHSSWNTKTAYDLFHEMNLTFCTIDQPQIGRSVPFEPTVTNDKAYIRFHGRNKEEWKKSISNFGKEQTYEQQSERYKYLYLPGELVEIDRKLKEIYDKVKEIYVIMNNHPTGYAVANAFELLHLLKERIKVRIPETTLKAFPRLASFSLN
ncbi:MAG: DUF72 domain-containing protein [Ignavibacteriales bacterium]|nr:DUF72 domain-containing protein [Ignavibacteriales bacterium]